MGGQCHPPFHCHGLARLEGMLPSLGPHKSIACISLFFWHWCRPANRFCTMDRIKPASNGPLICSRPNNAIGLIRNQMVNQLEVSQEPHRRPRPANQGRVRLAASSLARMAVATCARQACGCKLIGMLAGYLLFSSLLSLLAVVVRLRLANPSLSLALPWSSYSYACCNDSKHGFINIRTRVQIWVPLFSTLLFAKIDHHQPAAVSYGLV
jgi:hypothetical protein